MTSANDEWSPSLMRWLALRRLNKDSWARDRSQLLPKHTEAFPPIAMFLTSDATRRTFGMNARRVATSIAPLYGTCSIWRTLLTVPMEQLDEIDVDHRLSGKHIASYLTEQRGNFETHEAAAACARTMNPLYCTCTIWVTILKPFMNGVQDDYQTMIQEEHPDDVFTESDSESSAPSV